MLVLLLAICHLSFFPGASPESNRACTWSRREFQTDSQKNCRTRHCQMYADIIGLEKSKVRVDVSLASLYAFFRIRSLIKHSDTKY